MKNKKQQTADTSANCTTEIDKIKKEGNWRTKEELITSGDTEQNIVNPSMYEQMTVCNVNLYRNKSLSGIGSGLTSTQKSVITDYSNKGYKLRNELTPEEAKFFISKVVSPASDGIFSEDLVMYFNPNAVQGVTSGKTKVNITTVIQNAVDSRIPIDKKDCKQTIEAYYISWKKKRPLAPNEFSALKEKSQACKNEFYGDWGAVGGGKTDEIIDILTGAKSDGPTLWDDDSKWMLK